MRGLLLGALVACRAAATPVTAGPAVDRPVAEVPMSDPADYAIDHISRTAGETIFTRTGIGDPYRTGVPYPIFLALLRAFPEILGASTGEPRGQVRLPAPRAGSRERRPRRPRGPPDRHAPHDRSDHRGAVRGHQLRAVPRRAPALARRRRARDRPREQARPDPRLRRGVRGAGRRAASPRRS